MWNDYGFIRPGRAPDYIPLTPPIVIPPTILLSNSTVSATAPSGTTIGFLSTIGGTGSYAYTLISNPGSLFSISGSRLTLGEATDMIVLVPALDNVAIGDVFAELFSSLSGTVTWSFTANPGNLFALSGNQVIVNGLLSVGTYNLGFQASNGADSETATFSIPVLSVAPSWVPGIRPFRADSPANLPLPANTIYNLIQLPIANGFNYFPRVKFYIDIPLPTQTNVCSWPTPNSGGRPAQTWHRVMDPLFNGCDELIGDGFHDNEMTLMTGTECLSSWEFIRDSDTTGHALLSATCDILTDSGFGTLTPSFLAAGPYAIQTSCMVGALLKEEFTRYGAFNHIGLYIGLFGYQAYGNPLPPAINNDGSDFNGVTIEGGLLGIPPGTAQPAGLAACGPIGQAIWNQLVDYGVINCDVGGSFGFYMGAVFDGNNPTGVNDTLPYGAATSWTGTDIFGANGLVAICNLLYPMLQRIGYAYDGYYQTCFPVSLCAPQVQSLTFIGQPGLGVSRDSDSAAIAVSFLAAPQSLLDTATIAFFCAGTTGRLTEYLDQTFTVGGFTTVGAAAPIIYQSGAMIAIHSRPALLFDGTSNYLKSGTSTKWPSTGVYASAIIQLTDLLADYYIFGSSASGGLALKVNATTGTLELITNTGSSIGSPLVSIVAGSPYLISFYYFPGASFSLAINGVGVGGGATAVSAADGDILVGSSGPAGAGYFKGLIGAWSVCHNMSPAGQYSVENGLVNFWGPMGAVTYIHNSTAQDNFTDTNGVLLGAHSMDLGSGWTDQVGSHHIESNNAQPNAAVGSQVISTFAAGLANGVYQATLTPYNNGSSQTYSPEMVFRYVDSSNYLCAALGINDNPALGAIYLVSCIAGVSTAIAQTTITTVSGTGYVVKISFYGSNITISVNGTDRIVSTSTAFPGATICGIRSVPSFSPPGVCSYDTMTLTT